MEFSVEEFRWDLTRLLREGFPQGIPLDSLSATYFNWLGKSIDPNSVVAGCTEWKSVFRVNSLLEKSFVVTGQENPLVTVREGNEEYAEELMVVLQMVRYTNVVLKRALWKLVEQEQSNDSAGGNTNAETNNSNMGDPTTTLPTSDTAMTNTSSVTINIDAVAQLDVGSESDRRGQSTLSPTKRRLEESTKNVRTQIKNPLFKVREGKGKCSQELVIILPVLRYSDLNLKANRAVWNLPIQKKSKDNVGAITNFKMTTPMPSTSQVNAHADLATVTNADLGSKRGSGDESTTETKKRLDENAKNIGRTVKKPPTNSPLDSADVLKPNSSSLDPNPKPISISGINLSNQTLDVIVSQECSDGILRRKMGTSENADDFESTSDCLAPSAEENQGSVSQLTKGQKCDKNVSTFLLDGVAVQKGRTGELRNDQNWELFDKLSPQRQKELRETNFGQYFVSFELFEEMNNELASLYKMKECERICTICAHMGMHIRSTDKKGFHRFSSEYHFKIHYESIHSFPIDCRTCGQNVVNKRRLKAHLKRMQTHPNRFHKKISKFSKRSLSKSRSEKKNNGNI